MKQAKKLRESENSKRARHTPLRERKNRLHTSNHVAERLNGARVNKRRKGAVDNNALDIITMIELEGLLITRKRGPE